MWLFVFMVFTTVGVERNVTRELLTNDPPTTNAASAFCAAANVEAHNSANKIENRFIQAPLAGIKVFGWLSHLRCRIAGSRNRKMLSPGTIPVTKGQVLRVSNPAISNVHGPAQVRAPLSKMERNPAAHKHIVQMTVGKRGE